MIKNLVKFLERENIAFKIDYKLRYHSYCKVGGLALHYIMPESKNKMICLILYLRKKNILFSVIGESSNLVFLDDVIYGVIISTKLLNQIQLTESVASVESGVNLNEFLRILFSIKVEGYSGLEGIPGSIGGAVVMNAGAYGYTISDKLLSVTLLDGEGHVKVLTKEDCQFSSRNSFFRENKELILLEASFDIGSESSKSDLMYYKEIEGYHIARHSYQEFVLPNAGSIFTSKSNLYEDFCSVSFKFKVSYKIINFLFYNRLMRLKNRKSPDRNILNEIVSKFFGLNDFKNVYSIKYLNMFAIKKNDSYKMIDYIYRIKSILDDKVIIENEIVTESIVDWCNIDEKEVMKKLQCIVTGKKSG